MAVRQPVPDRIDPARMQNLMLWFASHRRSLPWRGETDPYRVWVSEVMLQQTQVSTVIGYYRQWMERFPTLDTLADAELESVLRVWEGLGYYSRARNLLHGARYVRNEFSGRFPRDRNSALTIPGVGPYIAGAVLSIAYNLPEPAIDGNVIRVITRWHAWDDDTSRSGFRRRLHHLIRNSYGTLEPRWVNQALMELGALVCLPVPRCPDCPMRGECRAYHSRSMAQYPRKKTRSRVPVREGIIYLIRADDKILLVRRPETGLLSGLWELPNCMFDETSPVRFETLHGIHTEGEPIDTVNHTYSHFKVRFSVQPAMLRCNWSSDFWIDHRWVPPHTLGTFPRPKVHIKALQLAGF